MNEHERNGLIQGYLRRLSRELAGIPNDARRELLDDVRGHVEEAWAASEARDQAALEAILARLGAPEDLAREERARLGLPEASRPSPDALAVAAMALTATRRSGRWASQRKRPPQRSPKAKAPRPLSPP